MEVEDVVSRDYLRRKVILGADAPTPIDLGSLRSQVRTAMPMVVFLAYFAGLGQWNVNLLQAEGPGESSQQLALEDKKLESVPGGVLPLEVTFSGDGRRVAYKVHVLSPGDDPDKEYVVVDGRKGEEFTGVNEPVFSQDGQHFAFAALTLNSTGKPFPNDIARKAFVVADGKKGPEFGFVRNPALSADGKHLAYVAGSNPGLTMDPKITPWMAPESKQSVVLDGKKGEEFDLIIVPPVFSQENQVAYAAYVKGPKTHFSSFTQQSGSGRTEYRFGVNRESDGKCVLLIGAKKQVVDADWLTAVAFSPDGKRLAYAVRKGEKEFLVVDGKKGREYESVSHPVFSPDGKQLAYVVGRQRDPRAPDCFLKLAVVVGTQAGEEFDAIPVGTTSPPAFSPDGRLIAYGAWTKDNGKGSPGSYIVAGEKKLQGVFRCSYPLVFSPDGKKIACGDVVGNDLWWRVKDLDP